MPKNYELLRNIGAVAEDCLKQKRWHEAKLAEKPLFGWSAEKHQKYHQAAIDECEVVGRYLFIRQMQIDPD